jgi:hypothetical protein
MFYIEGLYLFIIIITITYFTYILYVYICISACVCVDRPIRVDIRCDTGSYVGNYIPYSHELILPYRLLPAEFDILRKRLVGLTEVKKTIPIQLWLNGAGVGDMTIDDNTNVTEIENIILDRCRNFLNIYVTQGVGTGELMLSGVCRKGFNDERVLITIITTLASETTLLRVNCEDPVLCTALLEVFTKIINRPSGGPPTPGSMKSKK